MAQADIGGSAIEPTVLDLLMRERAKALSAREWRFRIRGFGYAIKDVAGQHVVTKLPQNIELGVLPPDMA